LSSENESEALVHEALRLQERFQREVIERFSICPWAKAARLEDRIRAHVVVHAPCEPSELRPIVDEWASDTAAEVAFIIAPLFDAGAESFEKWTAAVGALRADVFLSASFHPDPLEPTGTIHFLRQSPNPTVQLVRRARLEEIRAQDPPHYTDIFDLDLRALQTSKAPRTVAASVLAHNEQLLRREGRPALQKIMDRLRAGQDPPPKNP
jgi:hypothetical protein